MTGVDIVGGLLRAHAPLLEIVAEGNIKLGRLPEGVALPALLIREITSIERQPLKRGGRVRTLDRVSVTGRFENYRQQRAVMTIVKSVCAGYVSGPTDPHRISILTAGGGPDLNGPGNSFEKSQDFRVSFDAAA